MCTCEKKVAVVENTVSDVTHKVDKLENEKLLDPEDILEQSIEEINEQEIMKKNLFFFNILEDQGLSGR